MTAIRVILADDHGIVREGLRTVIEQAGIEVVGEAENGVEAIALAESLQPDVMLLDIRMPEMDGIQALEQIQEKSPNTSVIMLTTYGNPGYLTRAVQAGAVGYLSKDIDPERIPAAIRAAANHQHLLDRDLLQVALAQQERSTPASAPTATTDVNLSEREIEVLKLVADGLNNDAIAEKLTISLPTVKTHIRHIFEKLNVSDRTQAAVWAIRNNLA